MRIEETAASFLESAIRIPQSAIELAGRGKTGGAICQIDFRLGRFAKFGDATRLRKCPVGSLGLRATTTPEKP